MNYAIIVAGGSGSRMKTDIAKQFLEIDGRPLLAYTIQRFLACLPELQIILVLPSNSEQIHRFKDTYFPETKYNNCFGR